MIEPGGFGESFSVSTIVPQDGNVLPRLEMTALCDALRRLPADELHLAFSRKLVPLVALPGVNLYAACGLAALEDANAQGLKVIATAEAGELVAAARAVHGPKLLHEATSGLSRRSPEFSARWRLSDAQGWIGFSLLVLVVVASALLPFIMVWIIASVVSGAFFLSVISLRILCLFPPLKMKRQRPPRLSDDDLPVYSVLVPLFRETSVLRQLLGALTSLDYPVEKLDIKLILEETDILMQRAVAGIRLPRQFETIIVPAGAPQTKPRALNYALQFARGSLLTIYDAEDIPEPDQLRKSAERFAVASPDLACLQAQLTFYNPNENWLTRQFTIEYAMLFSVLLPVLANHRLPLPLGGTSNHFRMAALKQVGAWDPHNVTEDADLGLRLARFGFDAETLDSRTYEEATTSTMNWLRQRARWLKGFLLTWLVHMRDPQRFAGEVGPAGFWTAQAVTLGVFASALLHPLCLVASVWLYLAGPLVPVGASMTLLILAGVNLLVFVAGYGVTLAVAARGLSRRGIGGWYLPLATMPFYWLMMSIAAWYGLWQFVTAPFYWNKTEHGLSNFQRKKERQARRRERKG